MRDLEASLRAQRNDQGAEGICKTADDLTRYRRVLGETKPDAIIECGTYSGKSAIWFAREAGCPVFTIDVSPQVVEPHTRAEGRDVGVRFWHGSSTDQATFLGAVDWLGDAERVMVVLDSDHSAPHVLAEMNLYSPVVTAGCYMVVEDGITRWLPEQWPYYHHSPMDAIETWMLEHGGDWQIDSDIEDMLPTTQFPSGWLKRLP